MQKNLQKLKDISSMSHHNGGVNQTFVASSSAFDDPDIKPTNLNLNQSYIPSSLEQSQIAMKQPRNLIKLSKPAAITSVHMAKDIYRKGNTVS